MKTKPFFAALLPGLILAYLFVFVLSQPTPVQAAGFVVNANFDDADAHDVDPGNGICADSLGWCTLRAAIEESNALPGSDTITFANAMTITIDVNLGALPNITNTVEINASSVWDAVNNRPGVTLNGNNQDMSGLILQADSSQVYGVYITGFNWHGIEIESANNIIGGINSGQRNIISGNGSAGIGISGSAATGNKVWNNYIGLTPSGNAKQPNQDGIVIANVSKLNIIGGTTTPYGNVISGNTDYGIYITGVGTSNNQLLGNIIGPSADSTTPLGNGKDGIYLTSGPDGTIIGGVGSLRNTVAGNEGAGIHIAQVYGVTKVENNIVLANSQGGISVTGANLQITNNIILNNTGNGILVSGNAAAGNIIGQNSIYSNTLKGIKLDSGGNIGLAAPVIATATAAGASGASCASCEVEIFSDAADEGETYEGFTIADANGNWVYNNALSGPYVTATATDSGNNTSEFSAPKALTTNTPPNTPSNPVPANNATGISLNPTLSWSGGDPDGDPVIYEVWGQETGGMFSLLWYSGSNTSFSPAIPLGANTSYSWWVKVNDGKGGTVTGPTWTFTTGSASYKLFLPAVFKP